MNHVNKPTVQTPHTQGYLNIKPESTSLLNPDNNTVSFLPTNKTTSSELLGKLLQDRKSAIKKTTKTLNPTANLAQITNCVYNSTSQPLVINGINIDINKINKEYFSYIKLYITSADIQQILNCKPGTIKDSPYYNKAKNLAYVCAKITNNTGANYLLESILQLGLDVNTTHTNKKHTFLQIAAANGDAKVVNILLKNGAQVEQLDSYNNSALYYAVKGCRSGTASLLLKAGADVNCVDSFGKTLLHTLAEHSREKLAEIPLASLLIERGVPVDKKDYYGNTALNYAMDKGFVKLIMYLKEQFKDQTTFHDIIKFSNTIAIKVAIQHQKNFEIQDKEGKTALHHAVERNNLSIIKLLTKDNKADTIFSIKDNNGKTPLMCAIEKCKNHPITENNIKIIEELIKHETNFDYYNENNGKTALHYAAEFKNVEIATLLIKYQIIHHIKNNTKITFNNKDYNGKSAYDYALETGNSEITTVIKKYETTIEDYHQDGKTTLMYVVKQGDTEIVNEILNDKENNTNIINQCDNNGKSAFIYAVENNDFYMTEAFLDNNADIINKPDNNGKYAVMYAVEKDHSDIVGLLLNHNINASAKDIEIALKYALDNDYIATAGVIIGFQIFNYYNQTTNIDCHAKNQNSAAALTTAIANNNIQAVMSTLLKYKINFSCSNIKEFFDTIEQNNYPIVNLFIMYQLNIDYNNGEETTFNMINKDNETPITYAIKKGYNEIVEALLRYESDITYPDDNDQTPLACAVESNNPTAVSLLLKYESEDSYYSEKDRSTAAQYAQEHGYKEIVNMLLND